MILVVTGWRKRLVCNLATLQMVSVVHSCWHHGYSHFLLHSMANLFTNGGGRVVLWLLVAMTTHWLQVARWATMVVSDVTQNVASIAVRVDYSSTSGSITRVLIELGDPCRVCTTLVWSMVLLGVTQVAIWLANSLGVVVFDRPIHNVAFDWIALTKFNLFVKNCSMGRNSTDIHGLVSGHVLILICIESLPSHSVTGVVCFSDECVWDSCLAHHENVRWRFTNLGVVTLIDSRVIRLQSVLCYRVFDASQYHVVSSTGTNWVYTLISVVSVHSWIAVASDAACLNLLYIVMKVLLISDATLVGAHCVAATIRAVSIDRGGLHHTWLLQVIAGVFYIQTHFVLTCLVFRLLIKWLLFFEERCIRV